MNICEDEAASVRVSASERRNLSIDDPQGAFNYSCDMKVRDLSKMVPPFFLVGSSSMLAVIATILISGFTVTALINFLGIF